MKTKEEEDQKEATGFGYERGARGQGPGAGNGRTAFGFDGQRATKDSSSTVRGLSLVATRFGGLCLPMRDPADRGS